MKFIIFCAAMLAAMPVCAESTRIPVQARIINLATMPTHEALAFCDERDLACPAIRAKAEKEQANRQVAENYPRKTNTKNFE